MECDQPTSPAWVVDSLCSHGFLGTEFPSDKAILEVMASLDKTKANVMHFPYFIDSYSMIISMMSLDLILGLFVGESNETPSIDPFHPWLFFLKLSPKLCVSSSLEDSCLVLPSCLDGHHQGSSIAHKITHDEYLQSYKFITMLCGPNMVCHMILTIDHEFIGDKKDPWPKPRNGIYLA
jgi:hypothetical protein